MNETASKWKNTETNLHLTGLFPDSGRYPLSWLIHSCPSRLRSGHPLLRVQARGSLLEIFLWIDAGCVCVLIFIICPILSHVLGFPRVFFPCILLHVHRAWSGTDCLSSLYPASSGMAISSQHRSPRTPTVQKVHTPSVLNVSARRF